MVARFAVSIRSGKLLITYYLNVCLPSTFGAVLGMRLAYQASLHLFKI